MSELLSNIDPKVVALIAPIIFIFVIWVNVQRNARRIVQTQYSSHVMAPTPSIECHVRFLIDEMSTPCLASVDSAGLYLVSPDKAISKSSWLNDIPLLRNPVMIPWSDLDIRRAKFPMHNWIKFEIRGTKAVFFIRKVPAVKLLASAKITFSGAKA
jgi:hypothetical protein